MIRILFLVEYRSCMYVLRCMYGSENKKYAAEYALCVLYLFCEAKFQRVAKIPLSVVCERLSRQLRILSDYHARVRKGRCLVSQTRSCASPNKLNVIFASLQRNLKGWFESVRHIHNTSATCILIPEIVASCIYSLLGRRARSTNAATYRQCAGHGSSCRRAQSSTTL